MMIRKARDIMAEVFDVAVIGAGVVGSAIARELAQYDLKVALLEKRSDVGAGTSKANTAILHTGFDTIPGSLEGGLLSRGYARMLTYASEVGIPVERTGAVLVAWDEAQYRRLSGICDTAKRNGVMDLEEISKEQLYELEPRLGVGAWGGVRVPGESIICPFTTTIALATEAVLNGVRLYLDFPVERIFPEGIAKALAGPRGSVLAKVVINVAGLQSGRVDSMFGFGRFAITPRRGELIVFDKLSRSLISRIILPVPTPISKGVLISPTIFGNLIVGPTAEDLAEPSTATTAPGMQELLKRGYRILPALRNESITNAYAGVRAATEHKDYQIHADQATRYICVGGIRSTGLSACLGIAEHVAGLLDTVGIKLKRKPEFRRTLMPYLGNVERRAFLNDDQIRRDGDYGRVVCHCERVSRGEIRDALCGTIPARSFDGLRRRTRCLQGRCQGSHCFAAIAEMVSKETGMPLTDLIEGASWRETLE